MRASVHVTSKHCQTYTQAHTCTRVPRVRRVSTRPDRVLFRRSAKTAAVALYPSQPASSQLHLIRRDTPLFARTHTPAKHIVCPCSHCVLLLVFCSVFYRNVQLICIASHTHSRVPVCFDTRQNGCHQICSGGMRRVSSHDVTGTCRNAVRLTPCVVTLPTAAVEGWVFVFVWSYVQCCIQVPPSYARTVPCLLLFQHPTMCSH